MGTHDAILLGIAIGRKGAKSEAVTGSTPEIEALPNTRYVCGTVSAISITPADTGLTVVTFTSGSPAAALTVPDTVVFPEWFDPSSLSAGTVYEISVIDGVYASVGMWPAS